MAGKERDGCGSEEQPQREADGFAYERADGAGAHPRNADADEQQRNEEDGDAEGLEKEIGDVCAGEAGPVVRGMQASSAADGVEGGVRRSVGEESEKKEAGGDQHDEPEHFIEARAARGGIDESFNWLHG